MRGRTGIACLVVLGVAVAGCSGGSGSPNPNESTLIKRAHAGGQKFKPVQLPDSATQLADLVKQTTKTSETVRVVAATSAEGSVGRSSVEVNGMLVRPSGKQGAAQLKVVEVGGPNAGTTHVLLGGGVMYAKTDGESYPKGKSWLRISRPELASSDASGDTRRRYEEALGSAEQALQQTTTDGGVAALQYGRLTRNPEWETLAGTKVRRYSGTTKTATLAKATGDPRLRQMIGGGFLEYPWTIWVDSYGLPRRFNSTVSLPKAGTITSQATYSGWGEPLTISFPSADDVATVLDE
jgi:hypothetical protein